jgi:hypothetical protein
MNHHFVKGILAGLFAVLATSTILKKLQKKDEHVDAIEDAAFLIRP